MPDLSELDTATHISPEFRDAFPSWRDLRAYVEARATSPAFDSERALNQLLNADLACRLGSSPGYGWILRGSLALPTRSPPGVALPDHVVTTGQGTGIDPLYVMARPPGDIDLCARQLPDTSAPADQLARVVRGAVDIPAGPRADRGVGLGGLVHYSAKGVEALHDGRVVAHVAAQPIDPKEADVTPVDNDYILRVDLSPPGAAVFDGPPGRAHRSTVALGFPGFEGHRPDLYPTENQLADKLSTIAVPRKRGQPPPTFHRYKDLLDVQYLMSTGQIDAALLRRALENHPRLAEFGRSALPSPFRPFGYRPGRGEPTVPWQEGYDEKRAETFMPEAYADLDAAVASVGEFVEQLRAGGDDQIWLPRYRWLPRAAARLRMSTDRTRHATAALAARRAEQARRDTETVARNDDLDPPTAGQGGPSVHR
jgi:hypothetical protein